MPGRAIHFSLPSCLPKHEDYEDGPHYTSCPKCVAVVDWYKIQTLRDNDAIPEHRTINPTNLTPERVKTMIEAEEKLCCNNKTGEFSSKDRT
jgi:hypothetical protein